MSDYSSSIINWFFRERAAFPCGNIKIMRGKRKQRIAHNPFIAIEGPNQYCISSLFLANNTIHISPIINVKPNKAPPPALICTPR